MHALNDIGTTAQGYSFAGQIPPPGCATSGARWPLPKKTCIFPALLLLLAFCRVNTVLPALQFLPFLRFYRFCRLYRLYRFYRFTVFAFCTRFTGFYRFYSFYRFTAPAVAGDFYIFTVLPFYPPPAGLRSFYRFTVLRFSAVRAACPSFFVFTLLPFSPSNYSGTPYVARQKALQAFRADLQREDSTDGSRS